MSLLTRLLTITTGSRRRQFPLTPFTLAPALGIILLVVLGSLAMDRVLGLPPLLPGSEGVAAGIPLLVAGLALHLWCIFLFVGAKGTGIPVSPPLEVVTAGPYGWTRNPMIVAILVWLTGLGFLLHSVFLVFVGSPVFILINLVEVKFLEEPELERRLGASYREYKERVPLFIPRIPGNRRKSDSKNDPEHYTNASCSSRLK
ncbi:MAG: methyltransferase family protein [Planctomycetota bacterium]|jgi:protein-S-isoprenylcysteine O-methyltransferase Ste14